MAKSLKALMIPRYRPEQADEGRVIAQRSQDQKVLFHQHAFLEALAFHHLFQGLGVQVQVVEPRFQNGSLGGGRSLPPAFRPA